MRKHLLLLLGVILLYLIPSLVLHATYGPSYGLWEGQNRWAPDGNGGWRAFGTPDDPMPDEPSVTVPLLLPYLPIFLPGALLALFLLTPLSRRLDSPADDQLAEDFEDIEDDKSGLPNEAKKEPPEGGSIE